MRVVEKCGCCNYGIITDDVKEDYKNWRYKQVTLNANDYYKWSPNYEKD